MKWLVVLSLSTITGVGCASQSASNAGRVQNAQQVDPVTRENESSAGDPTGFGMEGTFLTDQQRQATRPAARNLHAHVARPAPAEHEVDHDADSPPGM
jgi:hypothetical protein